MWSPCGTSWEKSKMHRYDFAAKFSFWYPLRNACLHCLPVVQAKNTKRRLLCKFSLGADYGWPDCGLWDRLWCIWSKSLKREKSYSSSQSWFTTEIHENSVNGLEHFLAWLVWRVFEAQARDSFKCRLANPQQPVSCFTCAALWITSRSHPSSAPGALLAPCSCAPFVQVKELDDWKTPLEYAQEASRLLQSLSKLITALIL